MVQLDVSAWTSRYGTFKQYLVQEPKSPASFQQPPWKPENLHRMLGKKSLQTYKVNSTHF